MVFPRWSMLAVKLITGTGWITPIQLPALSTQLNNHVSAMGKSKDRFRSGLGKAFGGNYRGWWRGI